MKNTPRKNTFLRRPRDVRRLCSYLLTRSAYVVLSIAVIGWVGAASTMRDGSKSVYERYRYKKATTQFHDAFTRSIHLLMSLMLYPIYFITACAVSTISI